MTDRREEYVRDLEEIGSRTYTRRQMQIYGDLDHTRRWLADAVYGVSDMGCVLAQLARAPCMQGVADPRDLYAIRERVIAVRRDLDGLLDAVSRARDRMVPEPPCPDRYGLDADGDADLYDMWRRME